jgi:hypothetical protein
MPENNFIIKADTENSYCLVIGLYEFYCEIEWRPEIEFNWFADTDADEEVHACTERGSGRSAELL